MAIHKINKINQSQFSQTTHSKWLFSKHQITTIRKQTMKNAQNNFMSKLTKLRSSVKEEKTEKNGNNSLLKTQINFITIEESIALLTAYEKQLWQLCDHLQLPLSVKLTAITYFKRFYLYNSLLQGDVEINLCLTFK